MGENCSYPKPRDMPTSFSGMEIIESEPQRKGVPSPQEKKESKSFLKLLHNFTGYTSAHGIGRLGQSKAVFWKIFWSLVCMGAFAMFIYQSVGLFKQFIAKPVSTSVSVTFEKRLTFPAVTICNLNMLRKEVMPPEVERALKNKFQYSWSGTDQGDSESTTKRKRRRSNSGSGNGGTEIPSGSSAHPTPITTNTYYYHYPEDDSSDDDAEYNTDEYSEYRDDADESGYYDEDEEEEFPDENTVSLETKLRVEIDRLIGSLEESELYECGHVFTTLIRNCTWKGIDCKTGNLSAFWTHHWNYKYGNCYSFNSGVDLNDNPLRILKATKPGPSQGLLLEINIEQEQYIGALTVEAGVRVLLHDQGKMIFPYEEGFSVSPGMSTSVGIKKTQITRLDRFSNKSCLPKDELPRTNIYRRYKNITSYSQQACLNSCLGLSQRIRCKCSEYSFPSDRVPCDIFDHGTRKCLRIVKYLFNNDRLSCLEECRQPCREEVILKTISSSQWPSKAYKDYLVSRNEYNNQSDNLLQLNVFYNELNHEKIEESFTYGTINLLADIGGQLGLWIGISVITVCELLELIVMFLTVCVKKINAAGEVHHVPAYG